MCHRRVVSQLVARPRSTPVLPLIGRGALLAGCALLAALGYGPHAVLGPALLLFVIAAAASLPLPHVPILARGLGEVVLVATLIGAAGARGTPFLPYLVVPAFVVGLSRGLRPAVTVAAVGDVALLATSLALTRPSADPTIALVAHLQWSALALAVALLSGWVHRLRMGDAAPEAAYLEAHRLLTELHLVARQLSLGLDTTTLAWGLCSDLESVTGTSTNVIVVRGSTGLYHRLTGTGMLPISEPNLEHAWESSAPVTISAHGSTHLVVPVRMADRVVALAVSTFDATARVDPQLLSTATAVVERAASRLASAMLFDEVRELATQDERLRLARDIHDGIAQDVASLGFFVDDAMHGADEGTAVKLAALRTELKRIVGELRLSIFDLRLGADEALTLGNAIADHARRVGTLNGLTVHVSVEESGGRLGPGAEHDLMRIAQEAMTNVRRHAQAANVWVTVRVAPPDFLLRIEDDGRGLGLGPSNESSMGLKGIRERATRLGALAEVGNRPTGGTLVLVSRGHLDDVTDRLAGSARHG